MSLANRAVRLALPVLLVVALAACGSGSAPALQGLALADGKLYAEVGVQQRLAVTGRYAGGESAPVSDGLRFGSSDPSVATVDASGLLSPWAKGTAEITVTHEPTGLSTTATLTSREVVAVTPASAPSQARRVDTGEAYFRVSGLVPGALYSPAVFGMTDDVDLAVFSDLSMTPQAMLCASVLVGTLADSCTAPANAGGELWLAVDGEWTRAGATFSLEVGETEPVPLAATLAYPAAFPYASSIGATHEFVRVTGLTPGRAYEVRISDLTADLDLEVYGDRYEYESLCESYAIGTVDDACRAPATASGDLVVEIDGRTTPSGGAFRLSLTPR